MTHLILWLSILMISVPYYFTPFAMLPNDIKLYQEPNPGGQLTTPVEQTDSALIFNDEYFSVVSNVNQRKVWVNSMAAAKIIEPENPLSIYTCSFYTRAPILSSFDINQKQNGQCADFDIILYDGRNEFGRGEHRRIEAAGTWIFNQWDEYANKIVMRDAVGNWIDKGFYLKDTEWHKITFMADFDKELLLSVTVDGVTQIYNTPLFIQYSPEWGEETALWTSLASCSLYPMPDCRYIFWWQQDYKDLEWWRQL
jgi:hypothetical protein